MTSENDPDAIDATEASLLADLADALGRERTPDDVIDRAERLVAWFDVDDELVALLQSATGELAGTRGGTTTGMRFATADGSTEVELDIDGGRIVGHVVVGDADSVAVERPDGFRSNVVAVDELGRFELATSASGPHRLRLLHDAGATVTTDWFVIERHDDERTS